MAITNRGLLGLVGMDGAGASQTPAGLGPEATRLFHNPSAYNWGKYAIANPYFTPEDEILDSALGQQGYDMYENAYDWDEDWRVGSGIANLTESALAGRYQSYRQHPSTTAGYTSDEGWDAPRGYGMNANIQDIVQAQHGMSSGAANVARALLEEPY
tara:strand:- start:452 stop:922 length:471 start_codon:yes stop_codon:yes gene_type:complete